MKKVILCLLLIFTLLLTGCSALTGTKGGTAPTSAPTAIPAPTPTPTPTPKPVSPEVQALQVRNQEVWREMHRREGMDGRLMIPSVGINVALFSWINASTAETDPDKIVEALRQLIVDYEDSALLYNDGYGSVIADHSNQDFMSLSHVAVGDPAYILAGDHVVSLRCDLVTDGINTGNGITDADGKNITAGEAYTCYTCLEDWTHICVVGFEITDQDFFDVDRFDLGTTGTAGDAGVTTASTPAPTPAPTQAPLATTPPTPTPIYTPVASPTPSPTPTPEAVRRDEPWDEYDYYYDILGGYDIYADAEGSGGSLSIDGGYLP